MRAPNFWEVGRGGVRAAGLAPMSWLYNFAGQLRSGLVRPMAAAAPVICVGNFTVGGAGKTPTVLALSEILVREGLVPHVLTRGYGGSSYGPLRVVPETHDVNQVGDEAILLAASVPTWVCRYRPKGAAAAVAAGADLILMDDGLQNPTLIKDVSFAVIDGGFGFGNGCALPAGPLREPIGRALRRTDALVLIGPDNHGALQMLGSHDLPVLRADLVPGLEATRLRDRPVVAFAGIGRPSKFFEMLSTMGCDVISRHSFPDHHRYKPNEIMAIVESADTQGAYVVTTCKDFVRLPVAARPMVRTVPVVLEWRDTSQPSEILAPILERCRGS